MANTQNRREGVSTGNRSRREDMGRIHIDVLLLVQGGTVAWRVLVRWWWWWRVLVRWGGGGGVLARVISSEVG